MISRDAFFTVAGVQWLAVMGRSYRLLIFILSIGLLIAACRQPDEPIGETSASSQFVAAAQAAGELGDDASFSDEANPEPDIESNPVSATSAGTLTPESDAAPEAAAELVSQPAAFEELEPAPLNLIDHGYRQFDRQVVYAFIVENPNPNLALVDSEYEVTAFDGTGVSLSSDSEFIATLRPNQKLGIAGVLFLPQETPVELLTVGFNTGTPAEVDAPMPVLSTSAVHFRPRRLYSQVTGLVHNNSDQDLSNVRLSGIAYNVQDEIVGAGYAILGSLPANGRAGVDITLDTFGTVDRVELYPRLPVASLAQSGGRVQITGTPPRLLDSGFSQRDIEVFYGFLIDNPNLTYTIKNATYHLTAFDEAGFVVAVEEGLVYLLLPEQQTAVAGTLLVEPDTRVKEIELLINPGSFEFGEFLDVVSADRVTIQEEEQGRMINATITSPFDFRLESFQILALLYDANGQIIGGGRGVIESLPARGRAQVEIPALSAQTPDSAALFFDLGDLDRLADSENSG